jgi:hypothetical protein
VVAGDGTAIDSDYELGVEGTLVVSGIPNDTECTNHWVDGGTNSITVTDGRLTLAPQGGYNNKVCFMNILPHAAGPDLKLYNPTRSGSNFTFRISSINRALYGIEYKTALTNSSWVALTNVIGNGGFVTVSDSISATRFYRMRIR